MTQDTDSFYYPFLDIPTVKSLEIIQALFEESPTYFNNSNYPVEVKRVIQKMVGVAPVSIPPKKEIPSQNAPEGCSRWETLYTETQSLFTSLKATESSAEDNAERMAYFRTATSLLEKLVSLQERALGLKQISEFQSKVLDIMERLPADQRTQIMLELKEAISS